jgi:translation machinery-associated protein 16
MASRCWEFTLTDFLSWTQNLEVPDLTHRENVALYRTWDQREVAFVQTLRFIRISITKPELVIVSRPGKQPSLATPQGAPMDIEEAEAD